MVEEEEGVDATMLVETHIRNMKIINILILEEEDEIMITTIQLIQT